MAAAETPAPKKSKVRTGEDEQHGQYRLSTLNDDLLVHILSFLTLEEAISASKLSRRWRYLWTRTPNLDFPRYTPVSYVDRFLIFHKAAKIRAFKVNFGTPRRLLSVWFGDSDSDGDDYYSRDDLNDDRFIYDSWLYFAVSRNVEDLSFEKYDIFYRLPPCLFRSESLRKLVLGCRTLTLPKFICMPALKDLILSDCSNLGGDVIRCFTSGCPILDSLSLLHCNYKKKLSVVVTNPNVKRLKIHDLNCRDEIEIDAPSLLFLEFSGMLREKITVKSVVSLVELKLNLLSERQSHFASGFSRLLHSIHPEKLHLNGICIETLYKSRLKHPLMASSKTMCLHLCASLNTIFLKGIAYVLNSLPNLEILKLEVNSYPWTDEKLLDVELNKIIYEEPSHCLEEAFSSGLKTVKRVEIHGILNPFAGQPHQVKEYMKQYKHELELIGLFISNTVALEMISIRTLMKIFGKRVYKFEILYHAMQKITSFPRASSKALIEFD